MIDFNDFKAKFIRMLTDDINMHNDFEDIKNYVNELYEVFEKYDDNTIIKVISKKII